jgi:hypothetical protein
MQIPTPVLDALEAAAHRDQVTWTAAADVCDAIESSPPFDRLRALLPGLPGRVSELIDLDILRDPFEGEPPPKWCCGESLEEVLALGLSHCTCGTCRDNRPDGSSIPLMTDEEVRSLMAVCVQRGRDSRTRTTWLTQYTRQLVDEASRRRGGLVNGERGGWPTAGSLRGSGS